MFCYHRESPEIKITCLQDSGQKLTYAQIIQKKKEAAEALERERAAAAAAGQPLETKGENKTNI